MIIALLQELRGKTLRRVSEARRRRVQARPLDAPKVGNKVVCHFVDGPCVVIEEQAEVAV
jgi:hypothetical protein